MRGGLLMQPEPSVMTASQHFAQVPSAQIERSTFDRSHGLKTTFDAGYLIPVLLDEMLPGDTFNCNMQAFARLATPLKPVMDNMFLNSFFFFVPMRLIWQHWREMNGQQADPNSSTDYHMPKLTGGVGGFAVQCGSIYDYFGLPLGTLTGLTRLTCLPLRAYALCWNEFFRDQNLQDSISIPLNDGPDDMTIYELMRRGKRKDYFSGSLPFAQKGLAVTLPLGTTAPVSWTVPDFYENRWVKASDHNDSRGVLHEDNAGAITATVSGDGGWDIDMKIAKPLDGYADLSLATASTINAIRLAFQMQKMLERDARGGTRYTEVIKSHFGVVSPDSRQMRPELIGTGETGVIVQPVANTAAGSAGFNLGQLAAYGAAVVCGGHGFTYSATEHGYVIGLVSVRCDLTYQYGVDRMWFRDTRYDHYWPALSHLGEQEVLNQEIYWSNNPAVDEDTWGYQERYAEYRYKPSRVTGLMRTNAAAGGGTSIDVWHLGIREAALPELDADWIQDTPPLDQVIATPSEPHFILDAFFRYRCARPIPVYSVPGLVDHF